MEEAHHSDYDNYDARDLDAAGASTAVRAGYRDRQSSAAPARAVAARAVVRSMAEARVALAGRVPGLRVEDSRFTAAPEVVGVSTADAVLAAPAATREATLRGFLDANAAFYGLTPAQAAGLVKFSDYTNPGGGLSWVGLRQEIRGLPVFQGEILAAFTPAGALAHTSGNLAPALDVDSLPANPTLTPAQGAAAAASAIGLRVDPTRLTVRSVEENGRVTSLDGGPFVRETRTELVYFPLEPGVATLAYATVLWIKDDAYYLLVDANDGTLLFRKSIRCDQSQTTTYYVYDNDSPAPASPLPANALPGANYQAPGIARSGIAIVGSELPLYDNKGWIADGATTTSGNNVDAGLDVDSTDGIDSGGRTTMSDTVNRIFNFSYNPAPYNNSPDQGDSPRTAASRNGAVTNLFFWSNRYHDRLYTLGFTEAARNFQVDNFGRGGTGNDPVSAQVQDTADAASPNYNNANFYPPPDGQPGIMQMYLFSTPTPNRDGDLDADVFLHELTHGTSNRLHGNSSGLATQASGGMGEGWSDFYGRSLLSSADENVNGIYAMGAYVTYKLSNATNNYYYGIRRFPYAVLSNVGTNGKPHNPLTLADIDNTKISLTDGAYAKGPIGSATAYEVHNVGEVWCMMLLEFRARVINRTGWNPGNQHVLQIVTDAMKLEAISPTLLQGRDGLIAAINAGTGTAAEKAADVADVRNAFALRGAGAGATSTNPSSGNVVVTESFYPDVTLGTLTINDSLGNNNGAAEPGEDLILTLPLTNPTAAAVTPVTAQVGNATASYGTVAANSATARTFAYHVPNNAACGTLLTIPVVVNGPSGTVTTSTSLRVGIPTQVLAETFSGTTLPAGWTAASTTAAYTWVSNTTVIDAGNCVFAPDPAVVNDATLTSPAFTVPAGGQVTFKHRYALESGYDGGVLEISVAGGTWMDLVTAGGSFAQGGYAATISTSYSNPLAGRSAWTGTITTAATVVANLPASTAGKSVQLRWRLGTDSSTAGTGWYVDSVQVNNSIYNCAGIDADGDGIPDGYELAHGLNPNNAADAALDADGDGVSNLQEYIAGTDPQSATSVLRVTQSTYSPAAGLTVSFPTINGKVYQLEYKDSLADAAWTTLVGTYTGTGDAFNVTFSPADLGGRTARFYRVRLTGQ